MPNTRTLSQNYEIELAVAELMNDVAADDPLLSVFPLGWCDADELIWDQPENGYGLLSLRGLNGEPNIAPVTGFRKLKMTPGYYGETVEIDETEMTKAREPGSPNNPIDLKWILGYRTEQQVSKAFNQIRYLAAQLGIFGKYYVTRPGGGAVHADSIAGFNGLVASAWHTSPTTATPINDLLGFKNTLQTGTSSRFGKDSTLFMQTAAYNDLVETTDIRTVFKIQYGNTPLGLEGLNHILAGFDLPKIQIYDEGYYLTPSDAQNRVNFQRFLPTLSAMWVGTRPKGVPCGNFLFTRNMLNQPPEGETPQYKWSKGDLERMPWAQGLATMLEFFRKPPRYELDVWFNGGIAVKYPSAIAGLTWS